MEKIKYVYYQESDAWVGWLEAYPDYRSQGKSLEELEENLRDIYQEINSGKIPHIRKIGELAIK
jgi:predicted RNase H-like HicB family nuclease